VREFFVCFSVVNSTAINPTRKRAYEHANGTDRKYLLVVCWYYCFSGVFMVEMSSD